MSFKKLLADLAVVQKGVLAKSTASDPDDANIQQAGATGGDSKSPDAGDSKAQAAAAGGDAASGAGGGDTQVGATGNDTLAGGEGGGDMAKSLEFEFELPNGDKVKAMDAGAVLGELQKSITSLETDASEALGVCIDLIKAQQQQLDVMGATIKKLGAQGAGRSSVLTIVGKTSVADASQSTLAKSKASEGVTPAEFLQKAEEAFDKKALSSRDLALIETTINRGEKMPADLIKKVAAAVSLGAAA